MTPPRREGVEVYKSKGQWYWRLSRRGRTIADGAEAYATKANCLRAAHGVRRWASVGVITVWVRDEWALET